MLWLAPLPPLLLALAAWFYMIRVKPRCPASPPADPAALDALERRLMQHVATLALEIGERNVRRPQALERTADYVRDVFTDHGRAVSLETFDVQGTRCANVIAEHAGSGNGHEIVVVGAHYDTVFGTPGADDNATGVAALLEISSALRDAKLARTLRLVAFVNEEAPFYGTDAMGSRVHAKNSKQRGDRIVAMLSLEMLGCFYDHARSQRYPVLFRAFYPTRGNFLGVVGNLRSRPLVVEVMRHFMRASDLPLEGVATFEAIPGVAWSDHWSFWREGWPAVMLTDTSFFRYPYYHDPRDLPEQLNGPKFARATHGILGVVRGLTG